MTELRWQQRCTMMRHQQKTRKTRWVAVAAVNAADKDLIKTATTTMATAAATTNGDGSSNNNGGNDNHNMTTTRSTAVERAAQR